MYSRQRQRTRARRNRNYLYSDKEQRKYSCKLLQDFWFSNWMNKENIEKRSFHCLHLSIDQKNHCWASTTAVPELTDALQSGHTRELHSLQTHSLHEKHEVRAFPSPVAKVVVALLHLVLHLRPRRMACKFPSLWVGYGSLCTHDLRCVSFLLCEYGSLCTHDVRCVSSLLCEYGSLCPQDVWRVSFLLCEFGSLCTHDVRCVSSLLCGYGSLCTHDVWQKVIYRFQCLSIPLFTYKQAQFFGEMKSKALLTKSWNLKDET